MNSKAVSSALILTTLVLLLVVASIQEVTGKMEELLESAGKAETLAVISISHFLRGFVSIPAPHSANAICLFE